MTRKQLLSRFRKLSRASIAAVVAVKAERDAYVAVLEKERDDFRTAVFQSAEVIAELRGLVAQLEKAALL